MVSSLLHLGRMEWKRTTIKDRKSRGRREERKKMRDCIFTMMRFGKKMSRVENRAFLLKFGRFIFQLNLLGLEWRKE